MLRLGILASTKGTDMQAVIDAIISKKLNAVISVVVSDKAEAYALERAKNHNIKAVFLDSRENPRHRESKILGLSETKSRQFSGPRNSKKISRAKGKDREQYDKELSKILNENNVDLILLIGYMRFLSQWFVTKYKNKIMNIHPSLLPKYAGRMDKDVHAEVLKNNEKVTGATLHFVDEGADTGPIILQKKVKIEKNETVESLKEKVQKAEQEIIVKAIDLFEKGKIKVVGNKMLIEK